MQFFLDNRWHTEKTWVTMSDYELDQNEIHALDNAEKLNWDENYFEKIKGRIQNKFNNK